MFKCTPKILAHISSLKTSNFAVPEYILNQSDSADTVNLFHRHCPHRRYPLADPGTHVDNITCKFHDFRWDKNGVPLNNDKKLSCGKATVGRSGLVFKDFIEPDHRWVDDLSKETNLIYSHSVQGSGKGSWLWLMDAEADLLHVYKNGIHPFLSQQIDIEDLTLDQGDGWILQTHPDGWWLYIFPYVFVEYGNPGMVMVNHVVPHDKGSEYGFDYITQFYYDPAVSGERRMIFETLNQVFEEDIVASGLQKGDYFPLINATNKFENHCVHFGQWVKNNRV